MKLSTVSIIILIYFSCTLVRNQREVPIVSSNYSTFLKEKKIQTQIGDLMSHDWSSFDSLVHSDSIIKLCEQLNLKSNLLFKYYTLFIVYEDIKDSINETYFFKKAISFGYNPKDLKEIKSIRETYLKSIDTSMLNSIKKIAIMDQNARNFNPDEIKLVDSLNLHLMDSLIAVNNGNWIGIDEIGSVHFSLRPEDNVPKEIVVHHMEEQDNHRYFNLILNSCKKNNETWSVAEGIKWQQLIRFKHSFYSYYDFIKLRNIEIINDKLNLEDDETLLTISQTSKLLNELYSYGKTAVIYPTIILKSNTTKQIGENLIDSLNKYGFKENVRFDYSKKIPMDSLEKINHNYPFVIEIVN